MVDRLGLYNTIFTNPVSKDIPAANTQRWKIAYDGLSSIIDALAQGSGHSSEASLLRSLLLGDEDTIYLAWILAALVPWAHVGNPTQVRAAKRAPPPVAAEVIRNGLKLENKIMKVAADSVTLKGEIAALVEDISLENPLSDSPSSKRKQLVPQRDTLGFAIRKWGSHWRSSFMFALLCRLTEVDDKSGTLNLYEAHNKLIRSTRS